MEGGPPGFRRDSSCPALLRNRLGIVAFSPTGLSPSVARYSMRVSPTVRLTLLSHIACPTTPPKPKLRRFGLFRVRSPLLAESLLISLPAGTEMFHFPALTRMTYGFSHAFWGMTPRGLPHSEIPGSSACVRLPEAYRSLPRPSSSSSAKASTMCPY